MSEKSRPASRKLLQYLERFGVTPKDHRIFSQALVHRSALNESRIHPASNERLEFLGDSVLGLLVSQYLYKRFPDLSEGQMARRKAALVSEASLAVWAKTMRLGPQLVLGRGEALTGGREKPAILADTFEAFLAALYLDQGLEKSRKFIDAILDAAFKEEGAYSNQDAKSQLQELTQKKYKKPPRYCVSQTAGPDHAKTFEVEVWVEGKILATGNGRNKKEAEQRAAEKALLNFHKAE